MRVGGIWSSTAAAEGASDTLRTVRCENMIDTKGNEAGDTQEHHAKPPSINLLFHKPTSRVMSPLSENNNKEWVTRP